MHIFLTTRYTEGTVNLARPPLPPPLPAPLSVLATSRHRFRCLGRTLGRFIFGWHYDRSGRVVNAWSMISLKLVAQGSYKDRSFRVSLSHVDVY